MREVLMEDLKKLLAENCMLSIPVEEISETTPLFGPDSLGLDSIDALQLVIGIEKKYSLPIKDSAVAREVLRDLSTLRAWIAQQPQA